MLINEHFKSNPSEDNKNYIIIEKTFRFVYNYHNSSEKQLIASY